MTTMKIDEYGPDSVSDWFWDIIERAEQDTFKLQMLLESYSSEMILRFDMEFREAAGVLDAPPYTSGLKYRSEDDTFDLTHWVVSQGRSFYTRVWREPSLLAMYEDDPDDGLWAVAGEMLSERLGDEYYVDRRWSVDDVLGNIDWATYPTLKFYFAVHQVPGGARPSPTDSG